MSFSLFSVDHHPQTPRRRKRSARQSRKARAAEAHAVFGASLQTRLNGASPSFTRLWSADLVDRLKPTLTRYHE